MAISTGAALLGSSAIGAVGGLLGGGDKKQTSTSEPWGPQQQYLKDGFSKAGSALDNSLGMGTYGGQRVAGMNPYQTQGADFAGNYSQQYGMPGANALGAAGQGFLQYGQQFGGNASNIYAAAGGDPTQQILSNAGQYADNPYINGLIDSANRDTVRGLNEQALPSLARAASGTGNTNSTRAGVESAILQRGAADRMADTASNIRSQFFGKGLDMAQGQYNQNLQNQLQANGQLLQSFQQGGNTILQGQQVAGNAFDQSQAAGGVYQGQSQAELNAAQQAFAEQQNNPLNLIGKYQGIVNGNYGGTSTATEGGQGAFAGALQGGLGGLMTGAGIYGKLGGFGTPQVTPVYTGPTGGYGSGANYSFSGSGVKFGG